VGCVDVRRTLLGRYELSSHAGKTKRTIGLTAHVRELERLGVGEIIVNAVDRDGTQSGYDLKLIREVSSAVSIPIVACGGASSLDDFVAAVHEGVPPRWRLVVFLCLSGLTGPYLSTIPRAWI